MPAKSGRQYRLMASVAHGSIEKPGLSREVAKEFVNKTPSKKRSIFSKHYNKKDRKKRAS